MKPTFSRVQRASVEKAQNGKKKDFKQGKDLMQ